MSLRRILAVLFGVAAFGTISLLAGLLEYEGRWLAGFSGAQGIQEALADDAEQVLIDGDVSGYQLEVTGRDLLVQTGRPLPASVTEQLEDIAGIGDITLEPGAFADDASAGDDADDAADEPEPTATAEPTETPEPTAAPEPTETPEPTAVPEPTEAPEPTATQGSDDGDDGAPDEAAVAAAVADLDLSGVVFEPGSPVFDGSAGAVLDDVAARLVDLPGVAIEVQGHTGTDGDPDVNLLLSDDRAQAVRDYLISQGVDPERLTARGYGASQPLDDPNDEPGGDERIELVVVEGDD